jgi:hypothetical protein
MRQMFTLDKLSYLTTCNCSVYSTQKKNIFYYLLYKIIHKSECEEYCTYTDFMNYCHKTLKRINIMKEHDLKLRLCNKCDSWKYKNVYLSQKDYIVYLVSRSILYKYIDGCSTPLKKYSFIKKDVLENRFYDEKLREYVFGKLVTVQRNYRALNRFAYLWKLKRAPVASNTDLYLNEISAEKQYVFSLLQNGKLFYFTVKDLLTLIRNDLCDGDEYFDIEPRFPKNPYTNEFFQESHMYNLYFYIKYNTSMKLPDFLHYWFLKSFCIIRLLSEHESVLKKYAVRQYVWNATHEDSSFLTHIYDMLYEHTLCKKKIHIDDNFPTTQLVETFRPYAYIYYMIYYCNLDDQAHIYYKCILKNALTRFVQYNSKYGRKIVKSSYSIPIKFDRSFSFDKCEKKKDEQLQVSYNTGGATFNSSAL